MQKTFKTKIINKHDTAVNWSKSSYIPSQGEIVVFDVDSTHDYERVKVGNGVDNVNALEFITDNLASIVNTKANASDLTSHTGNKSMHIPLGGVIMWLDQATIPAGWELYDTIIIEGRSTTTTLYLIKRVS